MIGLENTQWSKDGQQAMSASINAGNIAGMTNVHWDDHYYNWLSGYSTDVGAIYYGSEKRDRGLSSVQKC